MTGADLSPAEQSLEDAGSPENEETIASRLAERVGQILSPYQQREGPNGFPALMAAEADEILAMPMSRRELAESVAAYRRKAADQEAIAMVAIQAFEASERFRGVPPSALTVGLSAVFAEVKGAGRPDRELKQAKAAIAQLYPDGVPSELELSHAELFRKVEKHRAGQKLKSPSRKTVIRARTSG